jgi:hypothetical protein
MKRVLCAIFVFVLPAFAAISQRQAPVSQWNSTSSSTCSAQLGSNYQPGDLIVVWTFWATGSSPNALTAGVSDSLNTYLSAVGPTVQPSASNAAAQIFYVKSTANGSPPLIKVTYYLNGVQTNANTSGCVFVEYQGADIVSPLDSVSEAISTTANATLDSGTASPANASLLMFGAGTWDGGSLVAGGELHQRAGQRRQYHGAVHSDRS